LATVEFILAEHFSAQPKRSFTKGCKTKINENTHAVQSAGEGRCHFTPVRLAEDIKWDDL